MRVWEEQVGEGVRVLTALAGKALIMTGVSPRNRARGPSVRICGRGH